MTSQVVVDASDATFEQDVLQRSHALPVVVDLSGLQVPSQVRPILIDHQNDVDSTLGQTQAISVE